MPFQNAATMRKLFTDLKLPSSYFHIADGSSGVAHSHSTLTRSGQPESFEFVTHCLTKQGDLAIALSHRVATGAVAVYWSLDDRIDSQALVTDMLSLQQYAFHPVFVPCLMLSEIRRMAVKRRQSIKERLSKLETALAALSCHQKQTEPESGDQEGVEFDRLFELLISCRRDQASREGRYDFWQSYYQGIDNGLQYYEKVSAQEQGEANELRRQAHTEIRHWAELTWQRFESLRARDRDHVARVEDASIMVFTRDMQKGD